MTFHFQGKQFTGPLDLLLGFIAEQKLNISELALSEVTEQYLRYLDTLAERQPDELADFLVIAARLLLLKARKLLPEMNREEEDGPSLEEQLRLYQAFVNVSRRLDLEWRGGQRAAFRSEPPRRPTSFVPPANLSLAALQASMVQLLRRLEPPKTLVFTTLDKAVSMKEKIGYIRSLLARRQQASFQEVLTTAHNRTEVIVSFLALLELAKQQIVYLEQEKQFGDILINRM